MATTPFVMPGYPLTDPRQRDPRMQSLGNLLPLGGQDAVQLPYASTFETRTDASTPPAGGLPPVQIAPLPPTPAPPVSAPTPTAPVTSPTFVEPQPAPPPSAPETPPAPETPAPAQQPDPTGLSDLAREQQQSNAAEYTKRLEGHSLYANTEKRLAEIEKGKGIESWLPHAIAWAALLQGQPGPLMKLQEQKRQTATMRELAPLLGEVRKMTLSGDYAGANDMLGQIVSLGGQRAPELMPYLMQANKDLEAKQRDSASTKFVGQTLKRFIDRDEATDPTGTKKSLIRPLYEEVKDAMAHNMPIAPDILKEMLTRAGVHMQLQGEQMTATSPLAPGETQVTPIAQTPTVSQMDSPMARKYAGAWGISMQDLTNLAKGQTIQTSRGPASMRDPLGQAIITGFNTQVQPTQADLEIAGKNLHLPPELMAAALGRGAPWLDVMTGKAFTPGYVPGQPDVYGEAQTELVRRQSDQVMAQEYAKNASDPSYFQRTGQVLMVRTPGPGESFGQLVTDQNLTLDQVKAAGTRYSAIDKKKYDELIVPAMRAYDDLGTYADFQKAVGNPSNLLRRLSVGVIREFEKRTGITLSPNATAAAAAEAYVDRAIEQSLKFIPRTDANVAEIGRLKAYIKGSFADTAQGEQAIAYIKQQLARMMSRELGTQLTANGPPGSGIGVAPTPAPAVPPRPSAGTAPTRARRPTGAPGTQVGTGTMTDVSGVTLEQIQRDPVIREYYNRYHGYVDHPATTTTPGAPAAPAPGAPAATTPAAPAPAKPLVPGKLR